jgi:SAM-dependent methyltransferase
MRVGRVLRRFERGLLQRVYGFDRWHVGHASEPYVADIVRCLNSRPATGRQAVVEIGCGLGDILRRLRFRTRLGLDSDPRVLAAARLLSLFQGDAKPHFEVFEFPEARLAGVYDAIIMVNWIHQIDPEQLRQAVHSYFAQHLRPGGSVVLDTVDDPAYRYNHDVHALAPPGAVIDHLGQYARGRHVWVVRRAESAP